MITVNIVVMLKDVPNYCIIREHLNSPFDVYFLHGYHSRKKQLLPLAKQIHKLGYNVILCDARGHGQRKKESNRNDWVGSLNDIKDIILSRDNDAILIGTSMGGTMALTLGLMNPDNRVKQIFAISAGHGKDQSILENVFRMLHRPIPPELEKMKEVLPYNLETCSEENKDKFFLIHARNDPVIPFTEFEKNESDLCLPSENTLVYDKLPNILFTAHILPQKKNETLEFIKQKIRKK
jgi:pimeloyl-ACP methyl ester carboxylesterase